MIKYTPYADLSGLDENFSNTMDKIRLYTLSNRVYGTYIDPAKKIYIRDHAIGATFSSYPVVGTLVDSDGNSLGLCAANGEYYIYLRHAPGDATGQVVYSETSPQDGAYLGTATNAYYARCVGTVLLDGSKYPKGNLGVCSYYNNDIQILPATYTLSSGTSSNWYSLYDLGDIALMPGMTCEIELDGTVWQSGSSGSLTVMRLDIDSTTVRQVADGNISRYTETACNYSHTASAAGAYATIPQINAEYFIQFFTALTLSSQFWRINIRRFMR